MSAAVGFDSVRSARMRPRRFASSIRAESGVGATDSGRRAENMNPRGSLSSGASAGRRMARENIMRMLRVMALLAATAVMAGCLSVDSNIKVKPDGTGTIEQTMLVNSSAMGMMAMMGEPAEGSEAPTAETMFSEEKLRADAAKLGEGVTYVSSTPVAQGEMKGVTAIYAFTDFNKLNINTSPDLDTGDDDEGSSGDTLDKIGR